MLFAGTAPACGAGAAEELPGQSGRRPTFTPDMFCVTVDIGYWMNWFFVR